MKDFDFLLTRSYHVKDFENILLFCTSSCFYELKTLYERDVGDTTL